MLFWIIRISDQSTISGMMDMDSSKLSKRSVLSSTTTHILYNNKLNENVLFDRGNKNVTLTLSWNVIPNAGNLPNLVGDGSHQFSFPNEYTTTKM